MSALRQVEQVISALRQVGPSDRDNITEITVITRRSHNARVMLAQRLRRWANISPALGERVVI